MKKTMVKEVLLGKNTTKTIYPQFTLADAEFRISQMEKEMFHHRDRLEKRIEVLEKNDAKTIRLMLDAMSDDVVKRLVAIENGNSASKPVIIETVKTAFNMLNKGAFNTIENRISVLENNMAQLNDEAHRQANRTGEMDAKVDALEALAKKTVTTIYEPIDTLNFNVAHLNEKTDEMKDRVDVLALAVADKEQAVQKRMDALHAAMNWGDKKREDEQRILTVTVSADGAVEVKR